MDKKFSTRLLEFKNTQNISGKLAQNGRAIRKKWVP